MLCIRRIRRSTTKANEVSAEKPRQMALATRQSGPGSVLKVSSNTIPFKCHAMASNKQMPDSERRAWDERE